MFHYSLTPEQQIERDKAIKELQEYGWVETEPGVWQHPSNKPAHLENVEAMCKEMMEFFTKENINAVRN